MSTFLFLAAALIALTEGVKTFNADYPLSKVHFGGRWYKVGNEMRHGWGPGTFTLRFKGSTSVGVEMRSGDELYHVCTVDGGAETRRSHNSGVFTIATGLDASKEHVVRCGRSNEAAFGETAFVRVVVDGGATALDASPSSSELRFEAIGDSITAGFAVMEPPGSKAGVSLANSDVWQTYERYMADGWATNEWSVVARSGIAVTDYGGEVVMKERFVCRELTWGGCSGTWDFSNWQADVVTINLGTNDYIFGSPTPDHFQKEYETLIQLVRSKYPNAMIACLAPLMYSCFSTDQKWINAVDRIEKAAKSFNDEKIRFYSTGSGSDKWLDCANDYSDWTHPTTGGNKKFAEKLLKAMTTDVRNFFPSKCGGSGSTCTGAAPSPTSPSVPAVPAPAPTTSSSPTNADGSCAEGWTAASWTHYVSYAACCPENANYDPSASTEECDWYNACAYPGIFAYTSKKSFDWVQSNDITAFFSSHGDNRDFAGKTIRVHAKGKTVDTLVVDTCGDSDCGGCCSRNAQPSGYLVDMEYWTVKRHWDDPSVSYGQVCWQIVDDSTGPLPDPVPTPSASPTPSSGGCDKVKYDQCGGQWFTGDDCCPSGTWCKSFNTDWSQCTPCDDDDSHSICGGSPAPAPPSPPPSPPPAPVVKPSPAPSSPSVPAVPAPAPITSSSPTNADGSCAEGWTAASWTHYVSYAACCPDNANYDPSASTEECDWYNACAYPGIFAYTSKKSFDWVQSNDITAFFSSHGDNRDYSGKTIRVHAKGKTVDTLVVDTCGDSDCGGCCSRNAQPSGYLVDMEYWTVKRHWDDPSVSYGQVCWQIVDESTGPLPDPVPTPSASPTPSSGGCDKVKYDQCGGQWFTGDDCCPSGTWCKSFNTDWSQCTPCDDDDSNSICGGSPAPAPPSPPPSPPPAPVVKPSPAPTPSAGGSCSKVEYDQCGGQGFSGDDCCPDGMWCKNFNVHWSQCTPCIDDGNHAVCGGSPAPSVPAPSSAGACEKEKYDQCGGQWFDGDDCCPESMWCKFYNEDWSQCTPCADEEHSSCSAQTSSRSSGGAARDIRAPSTGTDTAETEGGVFPFSKVRFIGRWYAVGGEMRHGWGPGAFMLRFRGSTSVRAEIRNAHSDALYHVCQVDGGKETKKSHKEGLFTIATGLSPGEHTVKCGRSNEGSYGETALIVIKLDSGAEALSPPSGENELRYEAIGDSITAGFAVEEFAGSSAGATLSNSDVWQTYERYVADGWATNELSVVARSGIAITDYGGEVVMKERWPCQNYVWGPCAGAWAFDSWQADVVTINLGTNDYVFGSPTPALFQSEYETLVSLVRSKYPNALIACIAPLVYSCFGQSEKWQNAVKSIEAAVNIFNQNGDQKVKYYSTGDSNDKWLVCEQDYVDYTHPTTAGNQKFAAKLLQKMTPDVRALFPSKCAGSGDTCTSASPTFTPSPSGAAALPGPAPSPPSGSPSPQAAPAPAQQSGATSQTSSGWKLWVGGSAGLSAGLCATPGCGGSYTKKYNVDACTSVGYKLQGSTVVEPSVLPWPHGQGAQPPLNECSNPDQLRRDLCPNILKFGDVWQPNVDGRTFSGAGDKKLIQGYGHAFTQVADNLPCGFCAAMRSKRVLSDGGWNYMIMMRIDVTDDISPEVDEVTAEFGEGVVRYPAADRIPFEYKIVSCETGQAVSDFSPAPVPSSPSPVSPAPAPLAPAPTPAKPAPAPSNGCANAAYSQCGGSSFSGETCCPAGHYCDVNNEWWSQCMPCGAEGCPTTDSPTGSPTPPPPQSSPTPAPSTNSPSPGACSNADWGQCGGQGFAGAKCCPAGSWCKPDNEWYHQCTPCSYEWGASCSGSLAQRSRKVRKQGFLAPILLHIRSTLAKHVPVPDSWKEDDVEDTDEL